MAFSSASSTLRCYSTLPNARLNRFFREAPAVFSLLGYPRRNRCTEAPQKRSCQSSRSSLHPVNTNTSSAKPSMPTGEDEKVLPFKEESVISHPGYDAGLDHGDGSVGNFGGNGSNGKFPPGRGRGDGNGDCEDSSSDEDEFGPVLSFHEIMKELESRGASLPSDMLEAAKTVGIQRLFLLRYLDMQASAWPLGPSIRAFPLLRNRMLADPSFLFKLATEIVIDTCCATFAEVQKRGEDFWPEFELYAADTLVGVVANIGLVGLLAPYARFGQVSTAGLIGRMKHAYNALPSSVFEAERPGCRFSIGQRIGTYFYKGIIYGMVGVCCALIGQGIANIIMTAKRNIKKSEEESVPVPPLFKTAALWGVFLGVSSNTRYQIINGMERLVEAWPISKRVPLVAMAFTVGARLGNNVYGGMQFVDWARWSGCQ